MGAKIFYLSANGTDGEACLSKPSIDSPCYTLWYILLIQCPRGLHNKIFIHVLSHEGSTKDCWLPEYIERFNYFNRHGPQCDLEITGIIENGLIPTFSCLNSDVNRQHLPVILRHIGFTAGYDYYADIYNETGDVESYTNDIPLPKFNLKNLKFEGIILDLTSIEATFEHVIFENAMIQHLPNWDYDCQINFISCTFSRTRHDLAANFGYPDWKPAYTGHFYYEKDNPFKERILLGPWPHSPIFMQRCLSVNFSFINSTWSSGSIFIFYVWNADIIIKNSNFTNIYPFQTFLWFDDFSFTYFERFDDFENLNLLRKIIISNVIFHEIVNDLRNIPNILHIATKSSILHMTDSIFNNTSGALYIYLKHLTTQATYWTYCFNQVLITNVSFMGNKVPIGILSFQEIFCTGVQVTECIFQNNEATDFTEERKFTLYNGVKIKIPPTEYNRGTALYVDSSYRNFTVNNSTFINNIVHEGGGSLYFSASAGYMHVLYICNSYIECCDTDIELKSGYIIAADIGIKLTNVTI